MNYSYITKNSEAKKLAKDFLKVKLLPFDSETDCLVDSFDWRRERQVTWQFDYNNEQFIIDLRHVDPQIFKPVFESTDVKKIIHNSPFDAAWLKFEHNIKTRNIGDTKLLENLVLGMNFPRQPPQGMKKPEFDAHKPALSTSLEFTLPRYGLEPKGIFIPHYYHESWFVTKHGQSILATEWDREKHGPIIGKYKDDRAYAIISEQMLEYDAGDVQGLIELYNKQMDHLAANGMANLAELEMRTAEITYNMMCRGIYIDKEGWLKLAETHEKAYYEALDKLQKYDDKIKWSAPGQVSKFFGVKYIEEVRNLDVTKLSPEKAQVYQWWLDANANQKMVTTYGRTWLEKYVTGDSRVHGQYTQIVNTGRYSADDPNLQQIPVLLKRGKQASPLLHRSNFIASKHKAVRIGYDSYDLIPYKRKRVLLAADFKSQELAILAIGSGEEAWLECLRAGRDLHSMVAEMMFPDWHNYTDKEKKDKRRIAKDINFGVAYGLGASGLDKKLEIGEEACRELLNTFLRTFPKIKTWLNQNAQFCVRTGTSYSFPPFNRLRTTYLESEDWRRSNIGKNNPVQGTAADMAKLAMVYANEELEKRFTEEEACIIHMNHDELVAEAFEDLAKEVEDILARAMTDACIAILDEPLTTPDIHIINNWLEAKD